MCKLDFRWFFREFQAILFGAEAEGFNQVHADLLEAPASALGSAANSPRNKLHFSTELADLGPKPATENTGKHKENSLSAYSSDYHYN